MSFRVWLGLEAGRRLGMGKVGRVFFSSKAADSDRKERGGL